MAQRWQACEFHVLGLAGSIGADVVISAVMITAVGFVLLPLARMLVSVASLDLCLQILVPGPSHGLASSMYLLL